ncbi:MAG: ethylbenzene dehydrogenase-related protein, partial [Planctomycetota bacterium]
PFSAAPKAHGPIPPASSQDPAFLTALAAGNPAARWVRPSPVEDLNAEGFGTLEPQPPPGQNVRGLGAWAAGAWSVVFWRELGTSDARDIQLRPGRAVPIAFAVWDGRKGDRDGQKCVTTWHTLVLER